MTDDELLGLLANAQKKTQEHQPFVQVNRGGTRSLLILGKAYPIDSMRLNLLNLRARRFLDYSRNNSFLVSPAGLAYYEQLQQQ